VDFIEQWFRVAPDGGSGVLEALYALTAAVVVAALLFRRRIVAFVAQWRRRPDRRAPFTPERSARRASR
jgi:hypothetical protein